MGLPGHGAAVPSDSPLSGLLLAHRSQSEANDSHAREAIASIVSVGLG